MFVGRPHRNVDQARGPEWVDGRLLALSSGICFNSARRKRRASEPATARARRRETEGENNRARKRPQPRAWCGGRPKVTYRF